VGHVAVEKARPEADGPGAGPTGVGSASGEAAFERDAAGAGEIGGAAGRDLPAGIEAVHVGHVAVAGFGLRKFLLPFEELAVGAGLVGDEFREGAVELGGEFGVLFEDLRGGDNIAEEFMDEGDVHGAAG